MKSLVLGATVRRLYSRGPDYLIIGVDTVTTTLKLLNLETGEIRFDFPDDWAPVTPLPLNWITTNYNHRTEAKEKDTLFPGTTTTTVPSTVVPIVPSSPIDKNGTPSVTVPSSPNTKPPPPKMGNEVSTTTTAGSSTMNDPPPHRTSATAVPSDEEEDAQHIALQQQAYQQLHSDHHHQNSRHTTHMSSSSSSSTELQRSTFANKPPLIPVPPPVSTAVSNHSRNDSTHSPSSSSIVTFTPWPGMGTKVQFSSSSSSPSSSRNNDTIGLKSILKKPSSSSSSSTSSATDGSTIASNNLNDTTVSQEKDDTDNDDNNDDNGNHVTGKFVSPASKSKRKRDKKKNKASNPSTSSSAIDGQRRIRWGIVQIRELKRAIGRSSSIPYYSQAEWILALSDIIIGRDEQGNMIELERDADDPLATLFTKQHNNTYEEIEDSEDEAILKAATISSKAKHGGNIVGSPLMKGGSPRMGGGSKHTKSSAVPPSPSTKASLPSPHKGNRSNELRSSPDITNSSFEDDMEPLDLGDSSLSSVPSKHHHPFPVQRRRATTLGIRTVGTVDQVELWREQNLAERIAALSPTDRLTCTGETRQMSHRHGKGAHYNPLFDYIPVKTRQEIIARDLSIANGLHADKYVRKNLIESQITDVILASRKSVGCSCAEVTEKSFKKDSLKEVQAKASALNLSIDGTKSDIINRIIQWYSVNQLCNKYHIHGSTHGGPNTLSPVSATIEPTIEHHDGAQGAPDRSIIDGEHNPLDPATAYIRGQTLEVEVDEDQWNYLVNGIRGTPTTVNRSPNYSPIVTTMPSSTSSPASITGTSTEPVNKYAELQCPCVLEGIGCHYDLCKCNLDDCRNRWRLHATAYTYDDDGVDEYRRQLLALLKEENKEYITEDDVPKVYTMMKHHFDIEREKRIKKDQRNSAKKERKAEAAAELEAERLRLQAEEEERERQVAAARAAQEEAMARAAALAYAQYQEEQLQQQQEWEENKKMKPTKIQKPGTPTKGKTEKKGKDRPDNTVKESTENTTTVESTVTVSKETGTDNRHRSAVATTTETNTVEEEEEDVAVIGEITVNTAIPTTTVASSASRGNNRGDRGGGRGRDRDRNTSTNNPIPTTTTTTNASASGNESPTKPPNNNQRRGNNNNRNKETKPSTDNETINRNESEEGNANSSSVSKNLPNPRRERGKPSNHRRSLDGPVASTEPETAAVTETVASSPPPVSPTKVRNRPRADSGPNIPSGYGAKHHGGELQESLNSEGANGNTGSHSSPTQRRNDHNGGQGRGRGGRGGFHRHGNSNGKNSSNDGANNTNE